MELLVSLTKPSVSVSSKSERRKGRRGGGEESERARENVCNSRFIINEIV